MSEWFLLVYALVLFAYLMLAAHWQPKGTATAHDGHKLRRPRMERRLHR